MFQSFFVFLTASRLRYSQVGRAANLMFLAGHLRDVPRVRRRGGIGWVAVFIGLGDSLAIGNSLEFS